MKPGAGLTKLRPELERTSREVREKLAAQLFDLAAVRTAMAMAAGQGMLFALIETPKALDLRDTEAARSVETWAAGEGFRVAWSARRAPEAREPDETARDLVLSWGQDGA